MLHKLIYYIDFLSFFRTIKNQLSSHFFVPEDLVTYAVSCVGIKGRLGSRKALGRVNIPPVFNATVTNEGNCLIYYQVNFKTFIN